LQLSRQLQLFIEHGRVLRITALRLAQ